MLQNSIVSVRCIKFYYAVVLFFVASYFADSAMVVYGQTDSSQDGTTVDARLEVAGGQAKKSIDTRGLEQELSRELVKLNELSRLLRELRADRDIQEQVLEKGLGKLNAKWDEIRRARAANENKVDFVDHQIGQTLANRLAAADIDNRLRIAEQKALADVLSEYRPRIEELAKAEARIELQRASLIVEQRENELRDLQRALSISKDRSKRLDLEKQVEAFKLVLREAELIKKSAELQVANPSRDLEQRMLEAKLQIQVSERISKMIASERAAVSLRLQAEEDWLAASQEMQVVQQQLLGEQLDTRAKKRDLDVKALLVEMQIDNAKTDLSRIVNEQEKLSEVLGNQHPAVVSAAKQVEVLRGLLSNLSEKLEDREQDNE
ncbi:MAG: hypothetical protein AAF483_26515 [Planctomycetota bacterium]